MLTWTQAWRKANKKGAADFGKKSKNRTKAKFQKAIVGMSLDDIKKKKAAVLSTVRRTLRRPPPPRTLR